MASRRPKFSGSKALLLSLDRNEFGLGEDKIRLDGRMFDPKEEVHVTLVGKDLGAQLDIAKQNNPEIEALIGSVIDQADWSFHNRNRMYHIQREKPVDDGFGKLSTATAESIVVLGDVPGLASLYDTISTVLGETHEPPPAHVTLYTRVDPQGIGLPNQASFDQCVKGEVFPKKLHFVAPPELYEHGLRLAAKLHACQCRKGSPVPYITHPAHVSVILLRHGYATDVAVAGLLHDVVEDQEYPLTAIEDQFGTRVARIVDFLSERKRDEYGNKRPWQDRKREGIERMKQASCEAVAVKVADTLHNARSIAMDVRQEGPEVWGRFNGSPQQIWNQYSQIAAVAATIMPTHALVAELREALEQLGELLPG